MRLSFHARLVEDAGNAKRWFNAAGRSGEARQEGHLQGAVVLQGVRRSWEGDGGVRRLWSPGGERTVAHQAQECRQWKVCVRTMALDVLPGRAISENVVYRQALARCTLRSFGRSGGRGREGRGSRIGRTILHTTLLPFGDMPHCCMIYVSTHVAVVSGSRFYPCYNACVQRSCGDAKQFFRGNSWPSCRFCLQHSIRVCINSK